MELSDIAHIISICNAGIAVLVMQIKNMKPLLLGQITINLVGGIAYLMLGELSGGSVCLIAIVQCVVMYLYKRKDVKPPLFWILLFVAAFIACSLIFCQVPADLLTGLAAVMFAIAVTREKASSARIWNALNPITWMVYDICVDAYGAIVMHAVIFLSVSVAIVRHDLLPRIRQKQ